MGAAILSQGSVVFRPKGVLHDGKWCRHFDVLMMTWIVLYDLVFLSETVGRQEPQARRISCMK